MVRRLLSPPLPMMTVMCLIYSTCGIDAAAITHFTAGVLKVLYVIQKII